MNQEIPKPGMLRSLVVFGVLISALAATSLYSYLLFHTIAELVAIAIAIAVFIVVWNARTMLDNGFLLITGTGLLFVAGIELLHTLAYEGMGIFVGYDANLPTQLWIAARYLLAGTLLAASFMLRRRPAAAGKTFAIFSGVFLLLLLSIFVFPVFPNCYVEGVGLTPFKVWSEYLISALLALGAVAFYRQREVFSPRVAGHLIAAILVLIASELAFTLYVSVYGIANLVGHLLMVLSFGLIYIAFVETGIRQPYAVLFTGLVASEERLRQEKDRLRQYLDIAGALFVVLDADGRVSLINRRASEVLGYPADVVAGGPWIERFIPPREREHHHALFRGLMRGDTEPVYARTSVLTADGGERIIEWHNTVLRDDDGAICGTLSSGEDITERQYAEAALGQANAKLNLLSAITRHDILNQINVARIYIEFAEEEIGDSATARGYLERAGAAIDEIQKQIEFSHDYQDLGVKEPVWQRVDGLVRESAHDLPLPAGIGLRVDLGGLEIYADPMVKKVFYNLIDNAVRHGGAVTEIRFSYLRRGQDLLILCEDDGVGIRESEKEAIFREAYRRRYGHGLFLVTGILGIMGASIREMGRYGEGARFEITVPNGAYRFGDGGCLRPEGC